MLAPAGRRGTSAPSPPRLTMTAGPRFPRLDDWLRLAGDPAPGTIDLGLERVRACSAAPAGAAPCTGITVGGTNGKGSCVALLEAMLRAGGYRVGAFTSPHLRRLPRADPARRRGGLGGLAGRGVRAHRRGTRPDSLTFFEFNTLAALLVFETGAPGRDRARGRPGRAARRRQPRRCRRGHRRSRSASITWSGSAPTSSPSGARRPASFAAGVRPSVGHVRCRRVRCGTRRENGCAGCCVLGRDFDGRARPDGAGTSAMRAVDAGRLPRQRSPGVVQVAQRRDGARGAARSSRAGCR